MHGIVCVHVSPCMCVCVCVCMRVARGRRPLTFKSSPPLTYIRTFLSFIPKVWLYLLWSLSLARSQAHTHTHSHTHTHTHTHTHRQDVCSSRINLFISFSETLDKFIDEKNGTRPWSVDLLPDQDIEGAIVSLSHPHTHTHINTHTLYVCMA